MGNFVSLSGVVEHTWSYEGCLYVRILGVHPNGSTHCHNLVFPYDQVVTLIEPFSARQGTITPLQTQGIVPGAWIFVSGEFRSYEFRVSFRDYLKRLGAEDRVSPELLAEVESQVGAMNRSQTEIVVRQVAISGQHFDLRDRE